MNEEYSYVSEKGIKIAINDLLNKTFPDVPVYGRDTVQGYVRPCFFTDMYIVSEEEVNFSTVSKVINCFITFFQKDNEYNEILDLNVIKALKTNLILNDPQKRHMMLKVGDRFLKVQTVETDYVGTENNILEITLQFNFLDNSIILDERTTIKRAVVDLINKKN
jgi:hypothetical protein